MEEQKHYKVLIVDDVSKNIQLVASFLQQAGYEINFAMNGKMALNHAWSQQFDLILLDIMMPEMDGFEVCQKLKSDPKTCDIPVIFLTAKTDIESITHAFNLGGVDYITKPFNKSELLARVKTHLELKRQQTELKELNATKDKFFSIIAHDLKSPLNQLLGLSNLIAHLLELGKMEEVRASVEMLKDSAEVGRKLLENLLEWSRTQLDNATIKQEHVKLKELTDEIIQLIGHSARQKNISLVAEIDHSLQVKTDVNMLRTVIRNLASNAVKFTPDSGRVSLHADIVNGHLEFWVKDTGIGISESDLPKLFRIDINPNSIGKSKEKGTGLGLIICKEFIEKNNGRIWVESKEGEGSIFKFTLPANLE